MLPPAQLMRSVVGAALLLTVASVSAVAEQAEEGETPVVPGINRYIIDTGPLRVRDQFLLGMGFLAFDPVAADVLPAGTWQIDLIATATNTFAKSDVVEKVLNDRTGRAPLTLDQLRAIDAENPGEGIFLVDGELYRTALAVRRGVGKGIQLEMVIPVLSFTGGIVDGLVEGFHDTFSFDPAGREGLPKDEFQIYARSGSNELFLDDDPGLILGDIVLGAKFDLLRGKDSRRNRLAIESLVKLPTGEDEPLGTSGSTDVGAQLLYTRYYSKACLHASFGVLYLGESEKLALSSQTLPSAMLAYERSLGSKTSGLLQLTLSESPFRDLDLEELAQASTQVTIGFKRVVGQRTVLFVGLTENLSSFNSTPDIGIHLGMVWNPT